MRRNVSILLVLIVLGLCAGAWAQSTVANYVIGPQDVLAITVFDQADLGGKFTVESDGTFSFPLVGRVHAGGLTLREFEEELKGRLAQGYFKNPQLAVAVDQYRSQRVFVMGEVRNPGPVSLTGGMSLIEALARAGSTLPTSSGEVVIVRRKSPSPPTDPAPPEAIALDDTDIIRVQVRNLQSGELSQNVPLLDGDTLFVTRAASVYLTGQVKNPGVYAIQADTTVLQALSLAGGITETGAINRVRIVRLAGTKKIEIRAKEGDVVEPGDTIIVPERFF